MVETGPMLSKTKRDVVAKFVKKMNGKRTIQRILIANNGMAATKAILSMRQWAYVTLGDERALGMYIISFNIHITIFNSIHCLCYYVIRICCFGYER